MIPMQEHFHRHTAIFIFALSVMLFSASLFSPAFFDPNGSKSGLDALLFGWLAALTRLPQGGYWLANPVLFASWALLGWKRGWPSPVLAVAALVLGTAFLSVKEIATDESGVARPIIALGAGYWLWLASMAAVAGGAVLRRALPRQVP
jgi:hypothetical protein